MIEFLLDFPMMVSPISAGGRCGCLFICSSRPSCLRWAILRFQWIGWEIWTRNHDVDPQMICVLLQVPDFLFSSSNSGIKTRLKNSKLFSLPCFLPDVRQQTWPMTKCSSFLVLQGSHHWSGLLHALWQWPKGGEASKHWGFSTLLSA